MKPVSLLMDAAAIDRALSRMTHQILEKNRDLDNLAVVGMQTRGVSLAQRIVRKIKEMENIEINLGTLDVTFYRDDYRQVIHKPNIQPSDIAFDITDTRLLLIDDVLFTGRTVRAALDALIDFGRPQSIQLAVLVDRGHRELPIQPDFVGLAQTTLPGQTVSLKVREIDDEDSLWLMEKE